MLQNTNLIEDVLNRIVEFLMEKKTKLSKSTSDGRLNSAVNEAEILDDIRSFSISNEWFYKENELLIKTPKARDWYDFSITNKEGTLFVPVNIKVSKCADAADNLNCKLGLYYALSGKIPAFSNSIGWANYFKVLSDNIDDTTQSDYYFLVINKENREKVFFTSLKSLRMLSPNGNNLPFQCNWGKNEERLYRNNEEAREFLLSCFAKSIKQRGQILQDFCSCFPGYIEEAETSSKAVRKEKNKKNTKYNVEKLGQVFTPQHIVETMLGMIKNEGKILEPSCGDGAFSQHLPGCIAIEIDESKKPDSALCMDFFDYPIEEKFDTIVGNPPYVRYKDIYLSTKGKLDMSLFDERSNLYLFFIHKCIQHLNPNGELIFIVPREFLKATSAMKLNEYIFQNGTITNIIDLGDTVIFPNYSPNCVIFRFEKGNFSRTTDITKQFRVINGQLLFTKNEYNVKFSDLFFVKVGGVSGADKCFISDKGNLEFVCSSTRQTRKTRRMFYNVETIELYKYKELLLSRKMKQFNDSNWYMWGRNYYVSDEERIYVNCKTRQTNPFYYHECKNYDGSVLAIFPKFKCDKETLKQIANELNKVNWYELGFVCDGRFLFSQKSLENSVLPETFNKYFERI